MSGAPRAKTSPLRATVPLSHVTKHYTGLRSPTVVAGATKAPQGGTIRRTASLDTIYLRGLFPRESLFWHRDRSTQTDRAGSLESLQSLDGVEDRVAKLSVRQRRRSCSREDKGDGPHLRNPPSPVSKYINIPPKSSRNSEEGLNQELELYASAEPLVCDRLQEPIPEGRKAPVAELIRERPFSRTRHSANPNSSEDSQGSSPDQERMVSGSSPQINRFSSRAPPDGCERILSKSVPILRPIPREVQVTSHPNALFTLKPSSHSAFETLHRGMQTSDDDVDVDDDSSPKVPDQQDP